MSTRTRTSPLVALPLLLAVTGATAQQLDLQSPTPNLPRDRAHLRHEESRTGPFMPPSDLYPHRPAVPYQPDFVAPHKRYCDGPDRRRRMDLAEHVGRCARGR